MSRTKKRLEYLEEVERAGKKIGHGTRAVEKLVRLCRRAFRAGEYWCNSPDPNAGRMYESRKRAVEGYALSLGLETHFPGLWPVFEKDGEFIYIPD